MARLFDSTEYISRTSGPSATAFTMMAWVRVDSFTAPSDFQGLMDIRTASGKVGEITVFDGAFVSLENSSTSVSLIAAPAAGVWFHVYMRCSGSGAGLLQAGAALIGDAYTTNTHTTGHTGTANLLRFGGNAFDTSNHRQAAIKVWDVALTDAEIEAERYLYQPRKFANLHLWAPMVQSVLADQLKDFSGNARDFTATGTHAVVDGPPISWGSQPSIFPYVATTDTSVAPGLGVLAISGYAPTLSYDSNVAPGKGALAISGYAPTLSIPSAVAPGKGSLEITGYAPTFAGASSVSPGKGALEITGYAPTFVMQTGVSPGKGALAITGYAPSFTSGASSVAPGVGRLSITGFAPTLQGIPVDFGLIPPVNNLEQLRKQANALLSRVYGYMPGYGPTLPAIDPDLDGRLFVKTSDQTVYQQQYGAWVAVDMTP